METKITGGSKQIDVKALAVIVWGSPASSCVVMTVTPVANLESADLNSSEVNKVVPAL
jgi:hypothetical protein